MLPNYSLPIGRVVGGSNNERAETFSQTQIMMTMQNMRHNFPQKKCIESEKRKL